jgi:CubicO group peptidase (beta-lactamase class C family)
MDMVRKGEVALDDPVSKFLPAEVKMPERGGRKITLRDLSTQSSGLPRMPNNFTPKDASNPYADYSVEQMYQFLSGHELRRDIGAEFEYSNLGVGLLGHALTRRAGMSYERLAKARIIDPLGMKSTAITLTPELKARFATGHSVQLNPVSAWDIPTLAGAGALRSTANDMLMFLAANLGYTKTPLAQAMEDEVSVRRPAGAGMEIAYGWLIMTKNGKSIIWHNGGTGGYRTFVGFDPKARAGVVVLSNASTPEGGDDIGRHLLDQSYGLTSFQERTAVKVDPKVFGGLSGQYELAPGFVLTVNSDGEHLYAQASGQGRFELFPEAEKRYFAKVGDILITFRDGTDGKASSLTLRQSGTDREGKRIGDAPPPPRETAVAPEILERYVGSYQVNPNMVLVVTREGGRLFTQATGQSKVEVFASTEKDFFLKAFDGRLTFKTDGGKAAAVVLHQGAMDIECKRIEGK